MSCVIVFILQITCFPNAAINKPVVQTNTFRIFVLTSIYRIAGQLPSFSINNRLYVSLIIFLYISVCSLNRHISENNVLLYYKVSMFEVTYMGVLLYICSTIMVLIHLPQLLI